MRAFALVVLVGCAQHPPIVDPGCLQSAGPIRATRTGSFPARDSRTITSVHVTGADPALAATLAKLIETSPGDELDKAALGDDLRRLWALGVVADVQVEAHGNDVTFAVTPQPLIDRVTITGDARDTSEMRRIRALTGTPFDGLRIVRMAGYLEKEYVHDGFLDAKVAVKRSGSAGTGVCVAAHRGSRFTIGKLTFPGRSAIAEQEIMKEVRGGTDVNHPGGIYDADMWGGDILRIKELYWDRGKANVDILEPKVERHGATIDVALPIKEGPTFHYGPIAIAALGLDAGQVGIHPGERFSRERVIAARVKLEAEHPGADVTPSTVVEVPTNTIAITLEFTWSYPWQVLGLLPRR